MISREAVVGESITILMVSTALASGIRYGGAIVMAPWQRVLKRATLLIQQYKS